MTHAADKNLAGLRVLVAGCGYVGTALAAILRQAGCSVWALNRTSRTLPDGVVPIVADLTAPRTLHGLPKGLDWVIYAAAARADTESYRRTYVDGPNALTAAIESQGHTLKGVIFCSSTRVYGSLNGATVDDHDKATPSDEHGRILLEAEAGVMASPWPAATVRFGGIYGPDRTHFVEMARRGDIPAATDTPHYTNRIHRDDAAAVMHHIMLEASDNRTPSTLDGEMDTPWTGSWLAVDQHPASKREVLVWLARHLGADLPPHDSAGDARPGNNKRCHASRLEATGYRFIYPTYREGYASYV